MRATNLDAKRLNLCDAAVLRGDGDRARERLAGGGAERDPGVFGNNILG